MKEHEYIIHCIDHYLIDHLVSVICRESLDNMSYPDGFRRIFDAYTELRRDYLDEAKSAKHSEDGPEYNTVGKKCSEKQKELLECFVKALKNRRPDLKDVVEGYFEDIGIDEMTPEKRACIYPYIVSLVREWEERKS